MTVRVRKLDEYVLDGRRFVILGDHSTNGAELAQLIVTETDTVPAPDGKASLLQSDIETVRFR
jgi:hypothetical protein